MVAGASAGIPQQRGAASVPASPEAPRASAAVRPGGTQYGRSESPNDDSGASNGHASPHSGQPAKGGTYGSVRVGDYSSGYDAPGDYGSGEYGQDAYGYDSGGHRAANGYDRPANGHDRPANGYDRPANGHDRPGNVYGRPDAHVQPDSYAQPDAPAQADSYAQPDSYAQADAHLQPDSYGQPETYGQPDDGYDADGYGLVGDYDGAVPNGRDPNYKARRHRPSANDTNVGTLADFASYGGWDADPQPDERYVQGYGPARGGRN